ncbi:hypothetical protein LOK49_LG06G03083 [Camellia lanceoleosa]|uniref:Uncharacterized protein n=1 Tax=Camellia lanceoleosa TaxID=1840588 RepID=A0ACC0HF16_9ERIC|nr:hypothetical protein LOK49_LG06G03083 [Camellia lanceoleosa]
MSVAKQTRLELARILRRRRRREVIDSASILGARRISQPKMGFITEILRTRCSEKTVGIAFIVSCLAGGFVGSRLGRALAQWENQNQPMKRERKNVH